MVRSKVDSNPNDPVLFIMISVRPTYLGVEHAFLENLNSPHL